MKKEKGSVTVFMSVMLLFLVMFFMAVIKFAKAFVVMALTSDACMTTQASLYASYNKAIRDAYGITVYTKPVDYLSYEATNWFNESVDPLSLNPSVDKAGNLVRMNGTVTVSYDSSDSLASDGNFTDEMIAYMRERDSLGNEVSLGGVSAIMNNLEYAKQLRERFKKDIEDAQNGIIEYKEHGLMQDDDLELISQSYSPEDVLSIRNSMYQSADSDRMTLNIDFDSANYSDISPKNPGVGKVADMSWSDMQVVLQSISLIDEMDSYYNNLTVVYNALDNKSNSYYIAQYITEMFSAFHYYGEVSLSGNYYASGDLISVNPYCETEYLLFGNGDVGVDSNAAKTVIFDNLYMGHLVNLMINQPVDERIVSYAMILSDGDLSEVNMIIDALYSAEAADLAYQDLVNVYNFVKVPTVAGDSTSDWGDYQYYMELFGLIECCRNQSLIIEREKCVMEINAANSGAEAREFSFGNAYTDIYYDVDTTYAQ